MSNCSCWFSEPPDPRARLRLLCFPYAGGTASLFYSWQAHFPVDIQICPVELPGRAGRIDDPMPGSVAELVGRFLQEARPYLDRPFSMFGHSLGALIAFELARVMKSRGMLSPVRLFASACQAPQVFRSQRQMHHLADSEFIQAMGDLDGTPDEILKHQELLSVLLPMLRADFRLADTYSYIAGEPLSCAITAVGGSEDGSISRGDLVAWHSQTTGPFNLWIVRGAHFFLRFQGNKLAKMIANLLSEPRPTRTEARIK